MVAPGQARAWVAWTVAAWPRCRQASKLLLYFHASSCNTTGGETGKGGECAPSVEGGWGGDEARLNLGRWLVVRVKSRVPQAVEVAVE